MRERESSGAKKKNNDREGLTEEQIRYRNTKREKRARETTSRKREREREKEEEEEEGRKEIEGQTYR